MEDKIPILCTKIGHEDETINSFCIKPDCTYRTKFFCSMCSICDEIEHYKDHNDHLIHIN